MSWNGALAQINSSAKRVQSQGMFKFCVWRRFRWERSHCIMSRKLLMAGSLQVRIHQIIVTTPVGEPGQFPCLRINLSAVAKIRFPMTGFTLGICSTSNGWRETRDHRGPAFRRRGLALRIDPGSGMDAPAVINSIRFGRLNGSKEAQWLTTISIDPVVVSRVRQPTPAR